MNPLLMMWMELAKVVHSMLHIQTTGVPHEGGSAPELKDKVSGLLAQGEEMAAKGVEMALVEGDKLTGGMATTVVDAIASDVAKDEKTAAAPTDAP